MDTGEFADRARAFKLAKEMRYNEKFEKLRRELSFEEAAAAAKPANVQHRPKLGRSVLRLP